MGRCPTEHVLTCTGGHRLHMDGTCGGACGTGERLGTEGMRRLAGVGAGGGRAGEEAVYRRPGGSRSGANRSPWRATRSRTASAVKNRSSRWRQASTSAQLTGVETVGLRPGAQRVGGDGGLGAVVLAPVDEDLAGAQRPWSSGTPPGGAAPARAARRTSGPARWPPRRSRRRSGRTAAGPCRPRSWPAGRSPRPRAAGAGPTRPGSSPRCRRARPGPGRRPAGRAGGLSGIRHIGACSSRPARLAAQISAGRSSITR